MTSRKVTFVGVALAIFTARLKAEEEHPAKVLGLPIGGSP